MPNVVDWRDPRHTFQPAFGGEWADPPEDCGNIPGFDALLDARADPRHPDLIDAAGCLEQWTQEIEELPLRIAFGRIGHRRNAART